MRMSLRGTFVAAALVACTPGKGTSETDTTADPTGTTDGPTQAATDAPTEPPGDDATAGTDPGDDTTAGTDPPPGCAPAPCVTKIEYGCMDEFSCTDPCPNLVPTDCGGPDLCPKVEIKVQDGADDSYDVVESEADARCVLQALRDRTPGRLRVLWGDPQGFMGDAGTAIDATISVVGDDVVRMDWEWIYNGCCVATYARIRRVVLQPQAFFDDCLAEPTTEKLIACFTAGTTPFQPAPDGWLPPWLVGGACDPGLPDSCGA